ncbi:hypothetical protein FKM82_016010 [Ascaphus truei]
MCIVQEGSHLFPSALRYGADVDVDHQLLFRDPDASPRPLTSLAICPLYISAAYHSLSCFRLLLLAGANPDYNSWVAVCVGGFPRGAASCLLEAVLQHGCDQQFVQLLVDFGANVRLVRGEPGRVRVNPEALQLFREAKSVCDQKALPGHSPACAVSR